MLYDQGGPEFFCDTSEQEAWAFASRHGSQVLRFDQVTLDRVILDGGVLQDQRM